MDWESVPVSIEAFKAANRRFATGVTIVTTRNGDAIHGFTVNAFASVTAEPPTVLVCVNRTARAHPIISESGGFCVNILALEQSDAAQDQQRTSHERHVKTMLDSIPWQLGDLDNIKDHKPKLIDRFDKMPAELRDDEILRITAGETTPEIVIDWPDKLPPPRPKDDKVFTGKDIEL